MLAPAAPSAAGRRVPPLAYLVSALAAAAICWPLFGGYLLHRDAVATPRSPLTAAAFGIDGSAPRAVPQDGAIALVSQVVDGGLLLAALLTLAVFTAGVGYARLAVTLLPSAGTAGATAASLVGIWNPFVAERLLQGHWSLLIAYAALGPIVCTVVGLARDDGPRRRRWALLAGLLAAAGITPTGSLLALIVALVTAVALRARAVGFGAGALWVLTALPWLVAAVVTAPGASVGGAAAFAARAEPGLGTAGTVLGLGGIWNADAVPASRGFWWALVATACLLVVVGGGTLLLMRHRREVGAPVVALGLLAAVTLIAVAAAATAPGIVVVELLLTHLPGAGLLRDTQKYLALAVPFFTVAAAAAAGWLRTWVPTGVAVTVIALLVVAPLPDLAGGVGGALRPVTYPDDYAAAAELLAGSDQAVAVVPTGPMRDYPWNHGPSLSPLPRMIDAPVLIGGELIVDGELLDGPPPEALPVAEALAAGDAAALRELGVGWVAVEDAGIDGAGVDEAGIGRPAFGAAPGVDEVLRGEWLAVYRIPGAAPFPRPSVAAWVATGVAHGVWLLCLLAGLLAALAGQRGGVTSRRTRANSSVVADHE